MSDKEYLVTRSELARIFGVSFPTLDTWRRNGMPSRPDPKRKNRELFNAPECIQWRLENYQDQPNNKKEKDELTRKTDEAKLRRSEALAERAEIDNDVKLGNLIEADQAKAVWSRHVINVRTRLLTIPDALAPRLANVKDTTKINKAVKRAIEDALIELSEATLDEDSDDEEDS